MDIGRASREPGIGGGFPGSVLSGNGPGVSTPDASTDGFLGTGISSSDSDSESGDKVVAVGGTGGTGRASGGGGREVVAVPGTGGGRSRS